MGSIREQVSSLTVEELTAAQLAQVGGKVFMSANAVNDQGTMNALTQVWRSVHAPTYGVPMPGSGKTVNGSGATMLDPLTNETAYVNGMSLHNASATDAATFTIYLQNAMFATGSIPPQSAVVVIGFGAEAKEGGAGKPLLNGLEGEDRLASSTTAADEEDGTLR